MLDTSFYIHADNSKPKHTLLDLSDPCLRLSSPSPGRSLGGTITRIEHPVRESIGILSKTQKVDEDIFDSIFGCTVYGSGAIRETDALRLSWFIVNVSIAHAFIECLIRPPIFKEALNWFLDDMEFAEKILTCFSSHQLHDAQEQLTKLLVCTELLDVFPYIIEPFGHVTRNRLENCSKAQLTREKKKISGVYYTPSDVADFMVSSLAKTSSKHNTWFDPACGTGIFLRSVLAKQIACPTQPQSIDFYNWVFTNVFGIDKSALATDSCVFVMLIQCELHKRSQKPLIWSWQRLKKNIACMDSLRIIPKGNVLNLPTSTTHLAKIEDIFPHASRNGFDHIVMNPPYADARVDKSLKILWHTLADSSIGKSVDIHLAFVEMMWRLTSEGGNSAAVLPLSIGTNTTQSYKSLRHNLLENVSSKEFLFFDREPQALFGEDIKTRNLILFVYDEPHKKRAVYTSRMLKWTAEQRPIIFTRERLTQINQSLCCQFIPKLGSDSEYAAYNRLIDSHNSCLSATFAPNISRMLISDATVMKAPDNKHALLASGTAYNFINAFFANGLPLVPVRPYSRSPLNSVLFTSEKEALAAYALLSSRISYWLWHVEGDGFHVTVDFLRRLPIWGILTCKEQVEWLSDHGKIMWCTARKTAIGSVNGGRQTYSFHCGYEHPSVATVEKFMINKFSLGEDFSQALDKFIQSTVSIDGKRRDRNFKTKSLQKT